MKPEKISEFASRIGQLALWHRNLATNKFDCSPALLDFYNTETPEQVRDMLLNADGIHPDDREKVSEFIRNFIADDERDPGNVERELVARHLKPDGQIHWIKTVVRSGRLGGEAYHSGAHLVIDQELQTHSDLQDALESQLQIVNRLQQASQQAQLGFYELDIESSQLTYVDEIAIKIFGLDHIPDAELNVSHFFDRMPESSQQKVAALLQNAAKTGETNYVEYPLKAVDGVVTWIGGSAGRAISYQGQPYVFGFIQEITAQKEQEVKLREALYDLKDHSERQRQMFAVIGHELRTPLASIKMMLDEQNHQSDPALFQSHIYETVSHVLNVLDDLKTVARPETAVESNLAKDRPNSILSRAISAQRVNLESARITPHLSLSKESDALFQFSAQSLRQIVINLIKNAIVHSQASDLWLTLDTTEVESDQVSFRLTIQDNGTGVPKEHQEKLFDPFYRVDTSRDGTGLGLSICKDLAKSLAGDIEYQDIEGKGACFILNFRLTLAAGESISQEQAPSQQSDYFNQLDILVAEDNKMIRMLTEKILAGMGANVCAAENGRDALRFAQEKSFDLVITDIFMPEMDGYELTEALRTEGYQGPIVGVTAATVGDEASRLLALGATRVIAKPIDTSKLSQLADHLQADTLDT